MQRKNSLSQLSRWTTFSLKDHNQLIFLRYISTYTQEFKMRTCPNAELNNKLYIYYPHQMYLWRGTAGDEADVPATKLPCTYRISIPSFPLHICRSRYNVSSYFYRDYFLHPRATALERERGWRNSVREQHLCHLAFLVIQNIIEQMNVIFLVELV